MAHAILTAPQFLNEAAAFTYVEAKLWPNGPVCPHCKGTERIGALNGKTTRPGLYKCYACKKPFTVRMGTIFEDSHLPLHLWLQVIHLMCASKKGISTRQIQRMLDCSMKTAWHLTHRIRKAMEAAPAGPMGGEGETVEADVTFVGRKEGTKVRRGAGHMRAVFTLVQRDGSARSTHIPNVRASSLGAVLERHASRKANLRTDEARTFKEFGHNFASHETVNHSQDEFARGDVHTNTVEGFFSILKRGV